MTTPAAPFPVEFSETLALDDLTRRVATQLGLRPSQVQRTIELLDDKNTVPFIARYRKEMTGSLDEVQIQAIEDAATTTRALHDRKGDVLRLIHVQGKLTGELAGAIIAAATVQAVEDLYLPYRQKRKTRASVAREKGLEALAQIILAQTRRPGQKPEVALEAEAAPFIDPAKDLPTSAEVYAGARDICAEIVAEDATVRGAVRDLFFKESAVRTRLAVPEAELAAKDPRGVYQMYYDISEPLTRMPPHRVLAVNRAEREDVIRVAVEVEPERALPLMHSRFRADPASPFAPHLAAAIGDGFKRLLAPAIEREVRAEITRQAEAHAIHVFATNVRHLLLQPPLRGQRILGIDPGFRTGCKLSIIDETGKYLEGATIFPHKPQEEWQAAKRSLIALIAKHRITALAIGNGTASRETETLAAEVIRDLAAQTRHTAPRLHDRQ